MERTWTAAASGGRLGAVAVRALALCCTLAPVQACREGAAPEAEVSRPVAVQRPRAGGCSEAARFSGNVEPRVRVDLAFKRGGYVQHVLAVGDGSARRVVEEGDLVRAGQVLAALRDGDYQVKLAQARAQLAQAAVAERQAAQDLERARALRSAGAIAPAAYEALEARAQAASAQARAAAALVDEASLAVADTALRAPLDGRVLKRLVEVGSLVGAGSPGFVLADTRTMKVVFGIPDVQLDRVRPGTAVEVTILGSRRSGEVSRVAPAADPRSRLFEVEVILPNPDGVLRAGMIAALRLSEPGPVRGALAVPLAAVVRPPGEIQGFAVFVADGGALSLRRVELGDFCGAEVEIRSGLTAADAVVVEGAAAAHDGERVAVVPPRPTLVGIR